MYRVVATGTWLYDAEVPMDVSIVESDRDFWFDIGEADGDLEEGETPHLNAKRRCYYVFYRRIPNLGEALPWPDSVGFMSVDEARAYAEAKLPSTVAWLPF